MFFFSLVTLFDYFSIYKIVVYCCQYCCATCRLGAKMRAERPKNDVG